jgi:hypothetical protein
MGRLPVHDGPRPCEQPQETSEDGCPGAWYRCGFVQSLVRYERTSSGEGVLNENLMLSRCHDPLVLEAIQTLEIERARCLSHNREKTR